MILVWLEADSLASASTTGHVITNVGWSHHERTTCSATPNHLKWNLHFKSGLLRKFCWFLPRLLRSRSVSCHPGPLFHRKSIEIFVFCQTFCFLLTRGGQSFIFQPPWLEPLSGFSLGCFPDIFRTVFKFFLSNLWIWSIVRIFPDCLSQQIKHECSFE